MINKKFILKSENTGKPTFDTNVVFMYWTGKFMNILSSYCGLVDARIRASDKDFIFKDYCKATRVIKYGRLDEGKPGNFLKYISKTKKETLCCYTLMLPTCKWAKQQTYP